MLWSSNGSRRGTAPVATICEAHGADECLVNGGAQTAAGSIFFRVFVDPGVYTAPVALWRSDGTAAGTRKLRNAEGNEVIGTGLVFPVGGAGLFWTIDSLWRTDGTDAGTVRVKATRDLLDDPNETSYPGATAVGNGELVTCLTSGEIVRSDGTAAGTRRFARLPPDVRVASIAAGQSNLFFLGLDPQDNLNQVWRTQGTPETTERIFNALPGWLSWQSFAVAGDRLLFAVSNDETSGSPQTSMDLWSSDGTVAGTRLIGPLLQSYYGTGFAVLDGQAVFTDGRYDGSEKVWRSDGTEAGTRLVRDFRDLPGGGGPIEQTLLGGRLAYSAWASQEAPTLVMSDGTAAGTRRLGDRGFWPLGLTRVGDRVYFGAEDAAASGLPGFSPLASPWRSSLWWTDGTAQGTARIRELYVAPQTFSAFGARLELAAVHTLAWYELSGAELWSSDGRAAGTRMVREIDPFQVAGPHHSCDGEPSDPGPGVVVRQALLFAADDGLHGRELWRTDGTAEGTRLVRDINPGRTPIPPDSEQCNDRTSLGLASNPLDLVPFRGGALFTADDGLHGRELWWTDGTTAGTRQVSDLRPGPAGSSPHDVVILRGLAYFIASDAGAGESLWRTDGTSASTMRVHDLTVGGTPSWASHLTATRDRLFFSVYNESTGAELWVSGGTAATTRLVTDLRPGPPGSSPQDLTAVGNVLVFAADDGVHGVEPWRSDGTVAGTRRLADINPGRDASSPGPFSLVGGALLTAADDGIHGRELWAIPLADVLQP